MKIKLLTPGCLPAYQSENDAAMDCRAAEYTEWYFDGTAYAAIVPLGFAVRVPKDHCLYLYSRSGHGFKHNITLANAVGIIDRSYRDELKVKLIQHGTTTKSPDPIQKSDRICQMILAEAPRIYLKEVDDVGTGKSGFGSSGV